MGSVLRNNHSVLELISSDQTFLNERLAHALQRARTFAARSSGR